MEFYASCPTGFEDALATEFRDLGLERVRRLKGRVTFEGEVSDAYRACLWSRLASRVLVVLARFDAADDRQLYRGAYDICWERVLAPRATISVSARGFNERLRDTRFSALRVKDALCDRMVDATGARPSVDTSSPDARIVLTLRGERASLNLDLCSEPLFDRLPRACANGRMMRPDYAALMLAQLPMRAGSAEAPALIDLACGGGAIVLEAAGLLLDRAAGRTRRRWGFKGWAAHEDRTWAALIEEADDRSATAAAAVAMGSRRISIVATDTDANAVSLAERTVRAAGLGHLVEFVRPEANAVLAAMSPSPRDPEAARASDRIDTGIIIADMAATPLGRMASAIALITGVCSQPALKDFTLVAVARDGALEAAMAAAPDGTHQIRLGGDDATISIFDAVGNTASTGENAGVRVTGSVDIGCGAPIPILVPGSEHLAHRLKKVARLRRRWAARTGVSSYRVYDADLPDYAASIDLYTAAEATAGRWLVISEYAAPATIEPDLARARFLDILQIASRVLDVEPEHVHARARVRSRGGSQYGRRSTKAGGSVRDRTGAADRCLPLIQEGGLTFLVNFDDYLDTGIFLDHRITRSIIRERAAHRRFLNLFGYTGTATVYAADGGADETLTVDLSNTYLDWAEENMARNGFTGDEHGFIRADARAFIDEMRRCRELWDLIFCDPPTFSNSTKMGGSTFDIQRDHVSLLIGVAHLLAPGGQAVFSTNLRTFRLDVHALERAGIEIRDITAETIPEDFARNPRIHHCYIVDRSSDVDDEASWV
ncbi:rRNA (guanine-N(2)-)-methyltransferase [Coriobacterium glomerans PW2]|uniref:Ribosomal RNA large subunit methyltransferase K/L n=1 Tax=Coriobacterium glomerans (strain ATCC 49209 / DSM 20642 / JCM 10262 / PW2) TaxID=700015 RepID=F2N9W7_CORGP|nr:bifunctional 23S rRNA (guanine(2069)-N(7))-methyltransferase RlmK/23S rRNA (guanine(2445)-N(2))-methyltransferase RlmL [Coriobacterium glomerans]AEB06222.1 rRNA (guanine-N(2)-)-methyltransferase [Coriobacterium glomerans PW2]